MNPNRLSLFLGLVALSAASVTAAGSWRTNRTNQIGYDDTPMLPGGQWHVHDGERPQPRIVTPGTDGAPPSDATVLFGGTDLSAWRAGDGPAKWTVEGGQMIVNGTGPITTREEFGDMQLHVEFATPAEVEGDSQQRGNSGVFLMGRYEIQVLDSFDNQTYPDGQASAMYGQYPPQVNASRGPGQWQAYDIFFQAPRFEGETLKSPGVVTVIHNGVLVQHAREFLGATAHRTLATYHAHPEKGPIQLQDHGNPVRYRNIWVRPIDAR